MSKICLITSIFKPYTKGGAETIFNNIVDGFKKTNHDFFIITLCPWQGIKSLFPRKYAENGVQIYRFYALNLFSYINIQKYSKHPLWRLLWHFFDMFNLHSYLVIKHILKKEKPQVVMTHNLKGIGYTIPHAIQNSKIKHVHTVHYVGLSTPSGLILKGQENSWQHTFFLTKLYQAFNRWLFNSPDIVISSSNFLLNFYNKRKFFPKSKKMVLTNPMNINQQKTINKKQSTEFNFIFVGQVEEYKGILLLIKVFKKLLSQTDKKVNLFIAGAGSALEKAKQLAGNNKNIKFLGYINNKDLNKIFVQANALVIPSLCYENSPTVIFESLE